MMSAVSVKLLKTRTFNWGSCHLGFIHFNNMSLDTV